MADDDREIDSPPAITVLLLSLAVHKRDRSILKDELNEEFGKRSLISHTRARSWYWQKVLQSVLHLIRE